MSANTYVDQDICAGCGGRCCKRHAGALFPSDIKGPMYRGLVELLSSGMYQIDWYDKNPMMSFEELRGCTMTLQTGELKRIENRAQRILNPIFGYLGANWALGVMRLSHKVSHWSSVKEIITNLRIL